MSTSFATLNDYQIIKTLGKGLTAKVRLGEKVGETQPTALKIFSNNDQSVSEILQSLEKEVSLMQKLNHPNLVKMNEFLPNATYQKQSGDTKEAVVIGMEYISGGELFDFVAQQRFKETIVRTYFKQMMDALAYLHSQGYAHRDLKPENIFLNHEFFVKIGDFGFGALLDGKGSDKKMMTRCGTLGYMAPEMLKEQDYTGYDGELVDVFAMGKVLFIMLVGIPPFNEPIVKDGLYNMIIAKKSEIFWNWHTQFQKGKLTFSPEFKDLFIRMVDPDPSKRARVAEILAHPWLKGECADMKDIQQEFDIRKARNDAQLERQRVEKEKKKLLDAEKLKGDAGQMHTGIGTFSRAGTALETMKWEGAELQPEEGLEENFNLENEERKFQEVNMERLGKFDFITPIFANDLLKFLLTVREHLSTEPVELLEDEYKLVCQYEFEETQSSIKYAIELLIAPEEETCVRVTRLEGDSFQFNRFFNAIQSNILSL